MRLLQTYLGTADLALLNLARPIVGVPNKLFVYSWAMTTGLPLPKLGFHMGRKRRNWHSNVV